MNQHFLKPKQTLNKAFLKVKPVSTQIEVFKDNLIRLLDQINETESEEFHKNLVSDFLKRTYYEPNFSINTRERNENQIDKLVYELYGLTEEEIRIVEGGGG